MKFKIGDYIKGTRRGNEEYLYTDEHMTKGIVIGIDDSENTMTIKILEHNLSDACIDAKFRVEMKYFDIYPPKQKDNRDEEFTWCPKNEHVRKVVEKLLKSVQVNYALDHKNKELFERITSEYD